MLWPRYYVHRGSRQPVTLSNEVKTCIRVDSDLKAVLDYSAYVITQTIVVYVMSLNVLLIHSVVAVFDTFILWIY